MSVQIDSGIFQHPPPVLNPSFFTFPPPTNQPPPSNSDLASNPFSHSTKGSLQIPNSNIIFDDSTSSIVNVNSGSLNNNLIIGAGTSVMNFDGRRMRSKNNIRKTVDYNASVVNWVQNRVFQHDHRDTRAIQPDLIYNTLMIPSLSLMKNPVNCLCTRSVRMAMNKVKCPIFVTRWTPEGRRLVTGASSGEFTLWHGLTFSFETILQAHDLAVRSMVWSHNDQWMLTGDHGGFVKYWQSNMNNVKMYQAHKEPIRGLSYCPADQKFASGSDDGTVRIWDFLRCHEERIMRGHGADVRCVDWHPQLGLIASGSRDTQQPVKLWDPRTGNSLTTIHAHKHTVMDLKWNRNGRWLLTASRDHLLKLFDIRKMKEEVQSFRGHKKEATTIAWHPIHEGLFSTGGSDGAIMFWLVGNEKELGSIDEAHDTMVWSLDWHPMGHILASGSNDHTTKFWTRNRPGDTMRDKYNLNTLPAGVTDDFECEMETTMTGLPGLGIEPELKSLNTSLNADADINTTPSIPGLDFNEEKTQLSNPNSISSTLFQASMVNNANNKDNKKKIIFTKPVPKDFEKAWVEGKQPSTILGQRMPPPQIIEFSPNKDGHPNHRFLQPINHNPYKWQPNNFARTPLILSPPGMAGPSRMRYNGPGAQFRLVRGGLLGNAPLPLRLPGPIDEGIKSEENSNIQQQNQSNEPLQINQDHQFSEDTFIPSQDTIHFRPRPENDFRPRQSEIDFRPKIHFHPSLENDFRPMNQSFRMNNDNTNLIPPLSDQRPDFQQSFNKRPLPDQHWNDNEYSEEENYRDNEEFNNNFQSDNMRDSNRYPNRHNNFPPFDYCNDLDEKNFERKRDFPLLGEHQFGIEFKRKKQKVEDNNNESDDFPNCYNQDSSHFFEEEDDFINYENEDNQNLNSSIRFPEKGGGSWRGRPERGSSNNIRESNIVKPNNLIVPPPKGPPKPLMDFSQFKNKSNSKLVPLLDLNSETNDIRKKEEEYENNAKNNNKDGSQIHIQEKKYNKFEPDFNLAEDHNHERDFFRFRGNSSREGPSSGQRGFRGFNRVKQGGSEFRVRRGRR